MKNRGGLFTGWRQVFNFTAAQNMKGTGFKVSTIGIGALIFVLFLALNCIMANSQLEESEKDKDAVIDIEDSSIKTIYYSCEDDYSKQVLETTIAAIKDSVDIKFKEATDDIAKNKICADEGCIVMSSSTEENVVKLVFNISEEAAVEEDDVEEFAAQFTMIVDNIKYSMAGLTEIQISMINSSEYVYSEIVDVDDVDEEKDPSLVFAEQIVPMLYSFLFYMIIAMYAQSIQKLVVAEKTSKLMETLLTSVKPYAVIMGKVLAMAAIGIGQTLIWLVCGVAGYVVGDKIALSIYPEYENVIGVVIELMKTDSEIAFTPIGIILALITMVLGYLVYCVLAGLSGAVVSKIEDMSSTQMIFMVPIFIGFFATYVVPVATTSKTVFTVMRMVPIISPFMVPAEFIIGKVTMLEGIISALISVATCFVLILFTGKVYKDKVFNRG